MRLTQDRSADRNWIRQYDAYSITLNEQVVRGPCILSPLHLLAPWPATAPAIVSIDDLQAALDLKPKILLLALPGSATDLNMDFRRQLRARAIGLETMERGAACRTYNVLTDEGRDVVAVFW